MRTEGRETLAKRRRVEDLEEQQDEETRAEVSQTEARARVVLRLATRSLMWVVLLGLLFYYLIKATLWVFYALTGILLVIVLAIFFAYLIAPLVELVRRPFDARGRARLMPRGAAIGVVYLAIFGSLGVAAWVLTPRLGAQMAEIATNAPTYLTNARTRAASLNKIYEDLSLPPAVRNAANESVTRVINDVGGYITGQGFEGLLSLLGYLPWLVLVPILAFFFLKDADSFRQSALMMLPQGRIRWRGDELFQDINSTLAAYIRAQLIACLIIGTVCTAGFAVFNVRYALVLGVLAGLLEFIPLLGPLVVAVVAATVAGFDSGTKAVAVLVFLGVLRIVQDYVLYPRIIGSGIHLHPLAVILAILAGHELAGVAGIFLAIPVIAVLTVTYRHWLEHRGSAGLVAELLKPAETPAAAVEGAPVSAEAQPAPLP
ncbi:MAG TPA: AI-2E family transporter, partial [Pyrinomonadaceae bacterium]|nr:AI-2E family transporter [Pyrinomonadaceae bacterium]